MRAPVFSVCIRTAPYSIRPVLNEGFFAKVRIDEKKQNKLVAAICDTQHIAGRPQGEG
jgi:hypothetical protein